MMRYLALRCQAMLSALEGMIGHLSYTSAWNEVEVSGGHNECQSTATKGTGNDKSDKSAKPLV